MQKISLKVLLRFLASYSHWNLVRRSEGYHLYFVTKNSDSLSTLHFPPREKRKKRRHARRRKSSKIKNTNSNPTVLRRSRNSESCGSEKSGKDVFIFSPIFETVEEAVQVGMENIMDEKSKRSSFESLAWDEFLPYKVEREEDDDDSFDTMENSTDLDSKESTPFILDDICDYSNREPTQTYEMCVRNQADRLLKDMLQLRRDIEEMNYSQKLQPQVEDISDSPSNRIEEVIRGDSEERTLRNRLEVMTEEIKKEMALEQILKENVNKESIEKLHQQHQQQQLQQQQEQQHEHPAQQQFSSEMDRASNTRVEGGDISKEDKDSRIRKFLENIVQKKVSSIKTEDAQTLPRQHRHGEKQQDGAGVEEHFESFSKEEKLNRTEFSNRSRTVSTRGSPQPPGSSRRRRKRVQKYDEKSVRVEIPFCSHNNISSHQQRSLMSNNAKYLSLERRKKKKDLHKVLTPDDQIAAKDILKDLLDIRDKNTKQGQDSNQVLDSMISIISLSSTSLNLPVNSSTNNTVQFKDLFDYEVNISESREVFAKLAMDKNGNSHTLEELFPWSEQESGGEYNKLRKCLN